MIIRDIKKKSMKSNKKVRSELEKEIINVNSKKSNIISMILIMLIVLNKLVYAFSLDNVVTAVSKGISTLNLMMLIFFVIYIVFCYTKYSKQLGVKKFATYIFISVALVWCTYLSIKGQGIIVSSTYITCFSILVTFILTGYEIALILFFTLASIFGSMIVNGESMQILAVYAAYLSIFVLLCSSIASVNYKEYLKNYQNRKTIINQKKMLEEAKENLEATVQVRTSELAKANELLMEEISMRQVAEVESVRSKLRYEETSKMLDKSIENEQSRSNFFENLSHDLKTPVNVIFSALQMLYLMLVEKKVKADNESIIKYTKIIRQNCYRLIRLVANLIDVTKIDSSHFDLNLQNCDIIKIVENITLSVVDYVESKRINLIFDTEVEEKIIACDPDKIERIMLNLLANAVKFTNEEGCIYVTIEIKDEKMIIVVKDTGIGIPEEKQANIFERYVQASKASPNKIHGSGIGLSLVKSLVELHGGNVSLKSKVGIGSEFIIELPSICMNGGQGELLSEKYSSSNIERIDIEFSDIYN